MANSKHWADDIKTRFEIPFGVRQWKTLRPFSCGQTDADRLLNGGIARAALNEINGAPSTNRTALAVSVLAHALDAGECSAWIDCSGTFDPESSAHAGLQLNRLLWINCKGNAEHAMKATDLLLHGGGFGLMVVDAADMPESALRRIPMASWFTVPLGDPTAGTDSPATDVYLGGIEGSQVCDWIAILGAGSVKVNNANIPYPFLGLGANSNSVVLPSSDWFDVTVELMTSFWYSPLPYVEYTPPPPTTSRGRVIRTGLDR